MGSTGSGSFGDYPGTGGAGPKGDGGSGGEPTNGDRCAQAFSATLQDIEHSEYYARTTSVPPIDTQLYIELRKRLVAVDTSGASVGNLPTSLNYLADCLASGFSYTGVITASTGGTTAAVQVDFAPDT